MPGTAHVAGREEMDKPRLAVFAALALAGGRRAEAASAGFLAGQRIPGEPADEFSRGRGALASLRLLREGCGFAEADAFLRMI